MESYQTILERKQEYYGKTEASYEFAAEEYALKFSQEIIKDSKFFLVQNTETLINHGLFTSKEKAEKYTNGNSSFDIREVSVS